MSPPFILGREEWQLLFNRNRMLVADAVVQQQLTQGRIGSMAEWVNHSQIPLRSKTVAGHDNESST